MTDDPLRPIRKVLVVGLPVSEAFAAFTDHMGVWWPLRTHSLEHDRARECILECKEGGALFETADDAPPQTWARVTNWTPPKRLALSWAPGDLVDNPTEVTILFDPLGERRSRIELIHAGWRSAQLDRYVVYQRGWDAVLVRGFQVYALELGKAGQIGQAG
ncbi:MAG: SRPBCC domain-containing protein [Hyphomicrobiales bacterium]